MVQGPGNGSHMAVESEMNAHKSNELSHMLKQSKKQDEQSEISRRSFLRKVWTGLGILALVEVIALCAAFLKPRKSKKDSDSYSRVFTVGLVDDFEPATVTAFREGHFYLARLDDGGFLALSRKCTHLGCVVPWNPSKNKFICPCHSSAFDITGKVLSPPAARSLDIFPVTIENNTIKVDTRKLVKRHQFDTSQITYP